MHNEFQLQLMNSVIGILSSTRGKSASTYCLYCLGDIIFLMKLNLEKLKLSSRKRRKSFILAIGF